MIPNTWQCGLPANDFLRNFLSKLYLWKLWCHFYNSQKSINFQKIHHWSNAQLHKIRLTKQGTCMLHQQVEVFLGEQTSVRENDQGNWQPGTKFPGVVCTLLPLPPASQPRYTACCRWYRAASSCSLPLADVFSESKVYQWAWYMKSWSWPQDGDFVIFLVLWSTEYRREKHSFGQCCVIFEQISQVSSAVMKVVQESKSGKYKTSRI